jgi:hypothetical protein
MRENLDLSAIEARAAAATPGPWREDWEGTNHFEVISDAADSPRYWVLTVSSPNRQLLIHNAAPCHGPDLTFIAHARSDIPALVAEVRCLEVALANMTAECDSSLARVALAEYSLASEQTAHEATRRDQEESCQACTMWDRCPGIDSIRRWRQRAEKAEKELSMLK